MLRCHRRLLSLPFALLSLLVLRLMAPEASIAQGLSEPCIGGTEYLIAFPDTVRNLQRSGLADESPETLGLLIYSSVDQNLEISRRDGRSARVALPAGEMIDYADMTMLAGSIATKHTLGDTLPVVRLVAERPIVVYAYMSTNFGTAGFTPLPVDAWGMTYFAASWPADGVHQISETMEFPIVDSVMIEAPAQILLIASEDNTQITLSPTDSLLLGCPACSTFSLNRGETYLLRSRADAFNRGEFNYDIAGVRISSTKPIGVISGNTRTLSGPGLPFRMITTNSPKDLTAEWLAPTEMHGRSFAFIPTPDDARLGHRKFGDGVRVIATLFDSTSVSSKRLGLSGVAALGGFWQTESVGLHYNLLSSHSVQAFHAVRSEARFDSTTGGGEFIGVVYSSWGSAMVELIPRRRWVSFAPVRAPAIGEGARHYVMVVTEEEHQDDIWMQRGEDAEQRLSFDLKIEGSEIVWANLPIDSGVSYRLRGKNGATFSGRLQGGFPGFEEVHPTSTQRKEKGRTASATRSQEYEYREKIAGMYAMPLVGSTCPTLRSDPYRVEVLEEACDRRTYRITRLDGGPLDLSYLRLDQQESENAEMELLEPAAGSDALDTAERAVVQLRTINAVEQGRARMILMSAAEGSEEIEIVVNFTVSTVAIEPSAVRVEDATGPVDTTVVIVNDSEESVSLVELDLASGDRGFSIRGTTPFSSWFDPEAHDLLLPGDTLLVSLHYNPGAQEESHDTLVVDLQCNLLAIPLHGNRAPKRPCTSVEDLDFGVLDVGADRTEFFEICNRGEAPMTFEPNGPDGALVSWEGEEFSISEADLQTLANVTLAPNRCVTIRVSFAGQENTGVYSTLARFYTNKTAGNCRDSSVWTAQVGTVSVDEESAGTGGLSITSITPNPSSSLLRIAYTTRQHEPLDAELIDAAGQVQTIGIERLGHGGTGEILIDVSTLPSGHYFVRLRSEGGGVVRGVTVVR